MRRSIVLAGTLALTAAAAAVAVAQTIPPPPGMTRVKQRTAQCARTLPKFSVTISSHNGPMSIDTGDNRGYASVAMDNDTGLIRTDGCRVLSRRPAPSTRGLGRRWTLRQRYFEIKQFSCPYRGPLVVDVRVVRASGRWVNRLVVSSNRGRALAQGELANGRGWLRVASACSLSYSR